MATGAIPDDRGAGPVVLSTAARLVIAGDPGRDASDQQARPEEAQVPSPSG